MQSNRANVFLGFAILLGAASASALEWNVPGDNSGTCSIAVPSCDTIGEAVAAASATDTIEVAAGTYTENGIVVDKALTINGAGAGSTFLTVNGAMGLRIQANDITVSNLTVQNSPGDGIRLDGLSVDNLIVDSVHFLNNTSDAIQIGDNPGTYTNTQIVDCNFTNSTGSAIRMNSTSNVDGLAVSGTTFSGGGQGIYQANDGFSSKLRNLQVDDCDFLNTTGTAAIFVNELRDSVIEDSTFQGNQRGLLLFKFFATSGVEISNVTIQRNQFIDSVSASVQIQIHSGPLETPIVIDDNDFTQNVGLRTGNVGLIHVNLADSFTHAQVRVRDNRGALSGTLPGNLATYGVVLRGNGPVEVSGNVFDGGDVGSFGTAANPPTAGVAIRSTDTAAEFSAIPSGATFDISCNRIFGFEHGVTIYDPVNQVPGGLVAGVEVAVNDNALVDNNLAGVSNGATPTIDAEDNFWGCADGPGNPGCDAVIGGVDASPVVTAPPICVDCLVDAHCIDTDLCNGSETCNTGTSMCQSGTNLDCDDDNPCTQDSCSPSLGCANEAEPSPLTCLTAPKAKLALIRNTLNESKDKVMFSWSKGNSPFADFGDPLTTTEYSLCIYDADGAVLGMTVPPAGTCKDKPCWKLVGKQPAPKGVSYKDGTKPALNDGVTKLKTKASTEGKAAVSIAGKGTSVPAFDLTGGLTLPVVVQIVTNDGPACWQGNFPTAKKNDGFKFQASQPAP